MLHPGLHGVSPLLGVEICDCGNQGVLEKKTDDLQPDDVIQSRLSGEGKFSEYHKNIPKRHSPLPKIFAKNQIFEFLSSTHLISTHLC